MKQFTCIILLLSLFAANTVAQEKLFTIEDAVTGQWRQFYPEHLSGVKAYGDNDFTHVKAYKEIILMNSEGKEVQILTDLTKINTAMEKEGFNEVQKTIDNFKKIFE